MIIAFARVMPAPVARIATYTGIFDFFRVSDPVIGNLAHYQVDRPMPFRRS